MLQIRRLEKIIENRTVLSIEELEVSAGSVVAIVGQPQSGKSLLMRLLTGTLLPSGGAVLLDGQDIHHAPSAQRCIGVLFEEDLLYERLSVEENLNFYRQLHGLPKSALRETLALVGLSDQARESVTNLSATARRRLALARLLLWSPSVYLLDQPILRCDLATQDLFAHLIVQRAQEGAMVLITDENLAWAGPLCSHVVELQGGRVSSMRQLTEEPVEGIVRSPDHRTPFRVPARKEDRILLFDPGEILYATSRDGKTLIRSAHDEATTSLTLQELEQRLTGRGFFKSHRAYLVNLQYIKAVVQYTRNSYTLQLNDEKGSMVPLSKQYEKELQELLGY